MQQPQQLNIKCTLGALKLSKQGSLDSIVARHRLPENNQASSFSANYESKVNSNYSKNVPKKKTTDFYTYQAL